MNGFELYQKIKEIDDKVKICFITAFAEEYYEEFKKAFHKLDDAKCFIQKPTTIDSLVKHVEAILDWQQSLPYGHKQKLI